MDYFDTKHLLDVLLISTLRFTYEVSPVFIMMEEVLLKKMQNIVGWSDDEGDGIFCPGKLTMWVWRQMSSSGRCARCSS